jgi:hypothetical protein
MDDDRHSLIPVEISYPFGAEQNDATTPSSSPLEAHVTANFSVLNISFSGFLPF